MCLHICLDLSRLSQFWLYYVLIDCHVVRIFISLFEHQMWNYITFDFNSCFHDYWWYSESTQNLCQTLALPRILIYSHAFSPPKTNHGWFISFHCKILNKLNISKVKPTWLWSFTLIYFLVQHICFCFLKLVYLCSWQWFLCTFLCLLVALYQGVLKTGHTVEASKENWCWEVVTAVTTHDPESLSSYFVGGFQRRSQKPAGQNLMVGSEETESLSDW